MILVEDWNAERRSEYIKTLQFVISILKEYQGKTVPEFINIFQDAIDREVIYYAIN